MGEAKRKKVAGIHPDLIADRLVAAWRNDEHSMPDEYDVFEEIMKKSDPDRIFLRAAMSLPEEDRLDFLVDLYGVAGNDFRSLLLGDDKLPVHAGLRLFTFILRGPEHQINELSNSDSFTKITKLFRACGLAHDKSNVAVCSLPIDAIAATNADPGDVRRVLETLWKVVLNGDDTGWRDEVATLLNVYPLSETDDAKGCIRVVTRLFIGGRLLPYENSDTRDLFDAPNYNVSDIDGDVNEEIYISHENNKVDASIRLMESADSLFESENLQLMIDGPFDWAEGIGMMTLNYLMGNLFMDAAINRRDRCDKADEAHVVITREEVGVALKYGSTFIGPVVVPMEMAQFGMEQITDWFVESAGIMMMYEDMATFQKTIQPICH